MLSIAQGAGRQHQIGSMSENGLQIPGIERCRARVNVKLKLRYCTSPRALARQARPLMRRSDPSQRRIRSAQASQV